MDSTAESAIPHAGNADDLACTTKQTGAAVNESSPALESGPPAEGFEESSSSPPEVPSSAQTPAADSEIAQLANSSTAPSQTVELARAAGRAAQASLTPEEKQTARKERRERTRKAKLEQHAVSKVRKRNKGRKRRGGKLRSNAISDGVRALVEGKDQAPDPFDEWLGRRLRAWCDGVVLVEGSKPPEGYAAAGEIKFDLNEDEIGEPKTKNN